MIISSGNTIFLLISTHRRLFRWQGRNRKDYWKFKIRSWWFNWPEFDCAKSTPRYKINVYGVKKLWSRRFQLDLFLILAVFRVWRFRSLERGGFEFHQPRFAAANLRLINVEFQKRLIRVNPKTQSAEIKFHAIQSLVQRSEDQTAFFGLAVNNLYFKVITCNIEKINDVDKWKMHWDLRLMSQWLTARNCLGKKEPSLLSP